MPQLSSDGSQPVTDIAQRTGFSPDAVASMLQSIVAGNGLMAQFNHREFGGSGQWMGGGAIMLSDMFNDGLKVRVSALCEELSALVLRDPERMSAASSQSQSQGGEKRFAGGASSFLTPDRSTSWWPANLGAPLSTGAQNDARYAFFPQARRLAIDVDGKVTIYDTQDHEIGGVSQQQSGSGTMTFTSQFGTVDVGLLPVVSGDAAALAAPAVSSSPAPPVDSPNMAAYAPDDEPQAPAVELTIPSIAPAGHDAIMNAIERLAGLHGKGILTDEEFAAKKAELLSRL